MFVKVQVVKRCIKVSADMANAYVAL
jgi:hypothetical protein